MHVRLFILTGYILAGSAALRAAEPGPKPAAGSAESVSAKSGQQEFQQLRDDLTQANRKSWEKELEAAAPRLFALVDANPKGALPRMILQYILSSEAPPTALVKIISSQRTA